VKNKKWMYTKYIWSGCTFKISTVDVFRLDQKWIYIKDIRNGCTLNVDDIKDIRKGYH
jgi:hypothetical protein